MAEGDSGLQDNCGPAENKDREIWREREGDYYAASIFVTEGNGIGINVGGAVFVLPIREWHALAMAANPIPHDPA